MGKSWQEIAAGIMTALRMNVSAHPELSPLYTAFVNFSRKYMGSSQQSNRNGQTVLIVMEKEAYDNLLKVIDRQAEEIDALELRIKTLLEAR